MCNKTHGKLISDTHSTRQREFDKSPNSVAECKLLRFLKQNQRLALAFSGGTDSALLLKLAKDNGADIKAYFVRSAFQPSFEAEDVKRVSAEVGAPCEFIDVDIFDYQNIVANPADRCYHCKRAMLGAVKERATRDGYSVIIDGTNASDDFYDRPGMRALSELDIKSPLKDAGLTKADVRLISKRVGLSVWDKPSYSCLATRVATGESITGETLNKIERAETLLFERGFSDFRVRYSRGFARIEVSKEQNNRFQEGKEDLFKILSELFEGVEQSDILR